MFATLRTLTKRGSRREKISAVARTAISIPASGNAAKRPRMRPNGDPIPTTVPSPKATIPAEIAYRL